MISALRARVRAPVFSHFRFASGAVDAAWSAQFADAVATIPGDGDAGHEDSATHLRSLLSTKLLSHTAIRDEPEQFFEAHRLLAKHSVDNGPGFWIRFTVHYNLCAGTVVALGNDAQVAALDDSLDSGALGCFALTEKLAGVNSGMVVNTTMDWDADAQEFILTTPDEGAHKNWISQGYTADKALVVADLRVDGTSCGPHGFIMDLRTGGELVDGVSLGDMGVKTTGNDLDNAWIAFDNVRLPKSALLNRYSDVVEDKFVQKQAGVTAMAMIGQRLFTGRIAVAQAALAFRKELFKRTKAYADNKKTWAPKGEPVLSGIPQLKALFEEADATAGEIEAFVGQCEAELAVCLREDVIPPTELTDAIAVCKVQAVEASIDLCFRLKQEVGSFALMAESGFAHQDFLQCCKFAEGDSRILMQKFARDQMRSFAKGNPLQAEEQALCEELAGLMGKDMEASGANKMEAWDNQWEKVYELARATMKRIVADRT